MTLDKAEADLRVELKQRANGVYIGAYPESDVSCLGYGETYKQARANAVAFNAAVRNDTARNYTFLPFSHHH